MNHANKAGTFLLGSHRVNRMGYGAMQLAGPGVFGPAKDPQGAIAVLREALALGVNHIDTADFYGPHVTNTLIREALHPYADDLLIVTKVGAVRGADASWNPASSPAQLTAAVHDNLKNLGLEVLDVVNFRAWGEQHSPAEGSIEEPLTVLAELQRRSADLESARIIEFARRTRCLAALRPFLEQRPDFSPADVIFPEPSSEWRVRTLGEDSASIRIFTLIRAPWRQKPKLLWRAAFPSRTALAARGITLRELRRKLPNVYLHRFLRFCSALPESIRAVRRLLAAEPKNPARQTIRSIPATDKTDRSRFSAR